MPNAHTHLAAVNDLLQEPDLIHTVPTLGSPAAQAAFLLGAISPDVRAVSGQPREATHFFAIPPEDDTRAQDALLTAYPILRSAPELAPIRAAFVAGYITHLVMDQTWLEIVVMPGLFIKGRAWGVHHPNWRLYSILMTWLEYRAAAQLNAKTSEGLATAHPDHWLPFIADRYLAKWRDHVVKMMRSDGARRTSQLFAMSNVMTAKQLEAIVLSEDRMADEAYGVVSPEQLAEFEAQTAHRSRDAVLKYFTSGD